MGFAQIARQTYFIIFACAKHNFTRFTCANSSTIEFYKIYVHQIHFTIFTKSFLPDLSTPIAHLIHFIIFTCANRVPNIFYPIYVCKNHAKPILLKLCAQLTCQKIFPDLFVQITHQTHFIIFACSNSVPNTFCQIYMRLSHFIIFAFNNSAPSTFWLDLRQMNFTIISCANIAVNTF